MQKTPSFGFRSFTKFETWPISKFLNLTKILRRNQILIFAKKIVLTKILIEYTIMITICRALVHTVCLTEIIRLKDFYEWNLKDISEQTS